MATFAMRLTAGDVVTDEQAATSFFWLDDPRSTFTRAVKPWLGQLGPVADLNIDFVRIALAAFAADRSVLRQQQGSNWNQRIIDMQIPVSDPATWSAAAKELAVVMGFLSGDRWTLTFTTEEGATRETTAPLPAGEPPQRVVLLSGGADSAIGGLHSRSLLQAGQRHILLSHFSNTMLSPIQRRVAEEITRLIPEGDQDHLAVHLARGARRINGTRYPSESSTRSRSLLFLALGLAVASMHGVPLWIPENGFASLNPPLGHERLGSLSTRTTHPRFLGELAEVLTSVGAHAAIENPFAAVTKGEMFQQVSGLIGADEAAKFLSATHSCGLTGQRAHHISEEVHCGVCFGCVLRRASFSASGIDDQTTYINPHADPKVQRWLDGKSVEPAVRNFTRRGLKPTDLAALSLPSSYPLRAAMDLCERGISDLATLYP